jgi:hypothetical protein
MVNRTVKFHGILDFNVLHRPLVVCYLHINWIISRLLVVSDVYIY